MYVYNDEEGAGPAAAVHDGIAGVGVDENNHDDDFDHGLVEDEESRKDDDGAREDEEEHEEGGDGENLQLEVPQRPNEDPEAGNKADDDAAEHGILPPPVQQVDEPEHAVAKNDGDDNFLQDLAVAPVGGIQHDEDDYIANRIQQKRNNPSRGGGLLRHLKRGNERDM